jgi:hypothetical protein
MELGIAKLHNSENGMTDPTAALVVARDALKGAKYAIRGREHTGFIDAALSTIEAAIAQPKDSGVPAQAPSRSLVAGLPTIAHANCPVLSAWQPIETAPTSGREMFVVRAFNVPVTISGPPYTSDPYCVWIDDTSGDFARWPHKFPPTHWIPLPPPPTTPPAVPEQDAIDAERPEFTKTWDEAVAGLSGESPEGLGDAAARPGPLSPSDPSPSVSAFGSVPIAAGEVRSAE